jgi:hypothetical protein
MLRCDGVIVEQGTGKITLVSTFSGVAAHVYPSPPRDLHVYLQLTSFQGELEIKLACVRVDLPEPEEVYATEHLVRSRGKLVVEQVYFTWHQFQFPSPGEYAFQLWSQGQCIAERRLTARQKGD